jgi:hypothetical protein
VNYYFLDKAIHISNIILTCLVVKADAFLINYLGILIHFRKLRNNDQKKIEERFEKDSVARRRNIYLLGDA